MLEGNLYNQSLKKYLLIQNGAKEWRKSQGNARKKLVLNSSRSKWKLTINCFSNWQDTKTEINTRHGHNRFGHLFKCVVIVVSPVSLFWRCWGSFPSRWVGILHIISCLLVGLLSLSLAVLEFHAYLCCWYIIFFSSSPQRFALNDRKMYMIWMYMSVWYLGQWPSNWDTWEPVV